AFSSRGSQDFWELLDVETFTVNDAQSPSLANSV
uniref:Capsid protein n=1 Tax=Steinernema glaseri TaxID=37863 RepID=A0A1I8AS43_9BILA